MRLILALIMTIACSFSAFAEPDALVCAAHQCVAVVDAGSSGSRLHIYVYDRDQDNSTYNIHELYNQKIKVGISNLELDSGVFNQYLSNLMSKATVKNLPIYFYATAGMRLIPNQDQQRRYQLITNWFAAHPEWQVKEIKTITGQEEGKFGWLALAETRYQHNEDVSSLGVMDMGGASIQVTFPASREDSLNNMDKVSVNFHGQKVNLFIHSFLGLGQTEVLHQYLTDQACFPQTYPLPDGVIATGDAAQCKDDMINLINGVHHVNEIVKPILKDSTVNHWSVIGGIAYMVNLPPFQFTDNQFTPETLFNQGKTEVCNADWSMLSATYPDNENLFAACLYSSYFSSLVVEGYGLLQNTAINYLPASQSDWSMGVVLTL